MSLTSLCVYCGSNPGRQAVYAEGARALAAALVARRIRLVYGGASVGIMGLLADAVLDAGGEVVGVIPDALVGKEIAHHGLSELLVTRSMHERKAKMVELADGFIAFPGGVGTLEELFEVWTWAQLGFHRKPCGLLNVAGYYDRLAEFLDHAAAEEFVRPAHRAMLIVEAQADRLLDRFEQYVPPAVAKWVQREDT
jgi:uncharacterized protein (TIGR00730 family)